MLNELFKKHILSVKGGVIVLDENTSSLLKLTGFVKHIVFRNESNGYTVLELTVQQETVMVVGIMPLVNEGEELELIGSWKTHPTFGEQFCVESFDRKLPSSTESILQYLSSGAIPGIGKVLAKRLVDIFQEKTLEVIENEPQRLTVVKGITPKKAETIATEFKKIFGIKELITFLERFSITAQEAIKIFQIFGTQSLDIIKSNPYVICDEPISISFDKADLISIHLEWPKNDNFRIRAGIVYVITHNMNNGHTCLPIDKLIPATTQFLETDEQKISDVLSEMKDDGTLAFDTLGDRTFVFTNEMHTCETYCAGRLHMIKKFPPRLIPNIEDQITEIETTVGIQYANLQKKAIKEALTKGILILTGGPGTGKTTTLNAIIQILEQNGEKVFLAAPTGRAAQRMSRLTGHEAKTIHRLLEVDWSDDDMKIFKHNEKNLLKCDALVIDEVSMVDVTLFESALKALPLGCRVILVGDSDQLPSVGAGNVLGDLIKSNVLPVVQLTEIFRQSMKSLIITNAHKIVNGENPDLFVRNNDFFFMPRTTAEETRNTILDLCATRLPHTYNYSPICDIQVLCPGRKGVLGTNELNKYLQDRINPQSISKNELMINGILFREGDKVMQSKNNYDIQITKDDGTLGEGVFNGDVGTLIEVDKRSSSMIVKFDDKTAMYNIENAFNLELAYAITIHKSQGNEFPAVIVSTMAAPKPLCFRNLLYTAVTRAKSLLILTGSQNTIYQMVKNDKKTRRYSALCDFLIRGD